jgi:hypothetical protein
MQKAYVLFAFGLCSCMLSYAQPIIKPAEAPQHIGDSVKVCGKIYGGKYLEAAKNQPTFLNMGAIYPNQQLTIVIWGNVRKSFAYVPEKELTNKMVCVTGRIEEFNNKPQIVINNVAQLREE